MKNLIKSITTLVAATVFLSACANKGGNSLGSGSNGGANFASKRKATGKTVFIFDPSHTEWALYDKEGNLLRTGRGSGGKAYCPDLGRPCRTIVGKFTVFREEGPDCVSAKFPIGKGGSPMPNCMYFHGGYAVHGSYHVPNYNASHGCIRVTPAAAAWLTQYMDPGKTTVIVRPY